MKVFEETSVKTLSLVDSPGSQISVVSLALAGKLENKSSHPNSMGDSLLVGCTNRYFPNYCISAS